MARVLKKSSKKAGLPQGTLVHVGEESQEKVKIDIFDYDENHFVEEEVTNIQTCFPLRNKPTITWINFDGIHDIELIRKLGECYGFHTLVLEDIIDTNQRPRMEDYADYIFTIVKMLEWDEKSSKIIAEHVSLILGSNFVISLQQTSGGDVFNPVRVRIRTKKGAIRLKKADYLLSALLDVLVDNYFLILEKIAEKTEVLEESILNNPTIETLKGIHSLRRELIYMRKAAWPLREVLNKLTTGKSSLISPDTELYIKDIYHNCVQIIDTTETLRDMLSGMLDIYFSSISNKMNEIMKVLTVITTFFMPMTFITGIYGTNFKYLPELNWVFGYPMMLLIILAVALFMWSYFKRKNWL